mgnify:CR=1 FL=1
MSSGALHGWGSSLCAHAAAQRGLGCRMHVSMCEWCAIRRLAIVRPAQSRRPSDSVSLWVCWTLWLSLQERFRSVLCGWVLSRNQSASWPNQSGCLCCARVIFLCCALWCSFLGPCHITSLTVCHTVILAISCIAGNKIKFTGQPSAAGRSALSSHVLHLARRLVAGCHLACRFCHRDLMPTWANAVCMLLVLSGMQGMKVV